MKPWKSGILVGSSFWAFDFGPFFIGDWLLGRWRRAASATDLGMEGCKRKLGSTMEGFSGFCDSASLGRPVKFLSSGLGLMVAVLRSLSTGILIFSSQTSSANGTGASTSSRRLITSASSSDPCVSRAATDQRFLDATCNDIPEPVDEPDIALAALYPKSAKVVGSCIDSDAVIACCRSLMKVGDSSRAS